MTTSQDQAFIQLLSAWNRREDLRSNHADICDLAAARRQLDDARLEMRRALDGIG